MHSNLLPLRALKFLAIAIATGMACLAWLKWLDPEVNFYRAAVLNKQEWAEKLDRQYPSKTVVYGGSSAAFAIDAGRLLRNHRLPVVNMGLHAGMGPEMLTLFALSEVRPGDSLVIALETDHLTAPFLPSSLAAKLSWATGNSQWLEQPWSEHPRPWSSRVMLLRPGGMYVVAMSAKFLAGAPLYRYSKDDLHEGGWMTTSDRRSFKGGGPGSSPLSADAKTFLAWLRDRCAQAGVKVAYLPPRSYTDPDHHDAARHRQLRLLEEISRWVPVLKDPELGLSTVREDYADTPNHLTESAARAYSDQLAGWIKNWDVWEPEELRALLKSPSSTATAVTAPPPRSL